MVRVLAVLFVWRHGEIVDTDEPHAVVHTTLRGIGFEREQFGTWAIYYLDEWLPPWEAGLVAYGGRVPEPDGG